MPLSSQRCRWENWYKKRISYIHMATHAEKWWQWNLNLPSLNLLHSELLIIALYSDQTFPAATELEIMNLKHVIKIIKEWYTFLLLLWRHDRALRGYWIYITLCCISSKEKPQKMRRNPRWLWKLRSISSVLDPAKIIECFGEITFKS